MSIPLFGVVIFTLSLLVIELSSYAFRVFRQPDRATVRKRLRQSVAEAPEAQQLGSIFKKSVLSDIPFLNRVLHLLPGVERLQLTLNQANLSYTLGFFVLLSMTLGLTGYMIASLLTKNPLLPLPAALAGLSLPLMYVRSKKKHRMARFEKQLPEALGLVARALRAGHAFPSGIKLAAEEFADPLGPEFQETLDEINFGVRVQDALKNLARRVDCPDLRFFVVSVILQRETGGNLAEIIEGLAHLMRERFKFRRKVRVLSAEGRLSAVVLLILPFVLFGVILVINPEYLGHLIHDPMGGYIIGVSLFMMMVGAFVVKRIVKVEV
jgi:tight adherence protein B